MTLPNNSYMDSPLLLLSLVTVPDTHLSFVTPQGLGDCCYYIILPLSRVWQWWWVPTTVTAPFCWDLSNQTLFANTTSDNPPDDSRISIKIIIPNIPHELPWLLSHSYLAITMEPALLVVIPGCMQSIIFHPETYYFLVLIFPLYGPMS